MMMKSMTKRKDKGEKFKRDEYHCAYNNEFIHYYAHRDDQNGRSQIGEQVRDSRFGIEFRRRIIFLIAFLQTKDKKRRRETVRKKQKAAPPTRVASNPLLRSVSFSLSLSFFSLNLPSPPPISLSVQDGRETRPVGR